MHAMTISALYLLSRNERRALKVPFGKKPTLLLAGNGRGKSAILKSLYDAFGAEPHRIDASWRKADVATVVEFLVRGRRYVISKAAGQYSVFDDDRTLLIQTSRVTADLSPFLGKLLDFKLLMKDHKDQVVSPPPAYIFAPFYVDQDKGWTEPWSSFARMYLPNSKTILAEYHSGVKPNEYYVARAGRDSQKGALREVLAERKVLDQSATRLREMAGGLALNYNLADFQQEVDRLTAESVRLEKEQVDYRNRIGTLGSERQVWSEQFELVSRALQEIDESLRLQSNKPRVSSVLRVGSTMTIHRRAVWPRRRRRCVAARPSECCQENVEAGRRVGARARVARRHQGSHGAPRRNPICEEG